MLFAGDFASVLHSDWSVWLEMLYQVSGNADLYCKLMRCMYMDSLDAVKPVAKKSLEVSSGGCCS